MNHLPARVRCLMQLRPIEKKGLRIIHPGNITPELFTSG